ncbi:MAG: response regulator transcription factor [Caulobacteraceae bacterium]|nr:response regulator transcription factor [Caulobacteraceae bacterium]
MTGDSEARHLLVVDDDDRIRDLVAEYLGRAGFQVTAAADAVQARLWLQRLQFDLVVLDVMMPGEDGLSLTRWIRSRAAEGAAPVLLLTARGDAPDRIAGLSEGADDYLAKPFEPEELVLRIEAILRRAALPPPAAGEVRLGPLRFDLARGELSGTAGPIRLTEAESRLLARLARAGGGAVDRAELARNGGESGGRAVDIQVTRLRRKIESDPANPRYLHTVRGRGYRLAPD